MNVRDSPMFAFSECGNQSSDTKTGENYLDQQFLKEDIHCAVGCLE
jgi:hypothetical protein